MAARGLEPCSTWRDAVLTEVRGVVMGMAACMTSTLMCGVASWPLSAACFAARVRGHDDCLTLQVLLVRRWQLRVGGRGAQGQGSYSRALKGCRGRGAEQDARRFARGGFGQGHPPLATGHRRHITHHSSY